MPLGKLLELPVVGPVPAGPAGPPPGVGLNPLPLAAPLARRGLRLEVGRLPPTPPSRGVAPLLRPEPPIGFPPSGRNFGPNGPWRTSGFFNSGFNFLPFFIDGLIKIGLQRTFF